MNHDSHEKLLQRVGLDLCPHTLGCGDLMCLYSALSTHDTLEDIDRLKRYGLHLLRIFALSFHCKGGVHGVQGGLSPGTRNKFKIL